jgi:hypothetical protein
MFWIEKSTKKLFVSDVFSTHVEFNLSQNFIYFLFCQLTHHWIRFGFFVDFSFPKSTVCDVANTSINIVFRNVTVSVDINEL